VAAVTELARAKINLYLHVTGRRADGYHTLDSLFAFANVGDVIRARSSVNLSLCIAGPFAAGLVAGESNLVLRAARALQRVAGASGRVMGAELSLRKNLPNASGIGGGSADAAATLRALCRLWKLRIRPRALAAIALSLGADVPACLLSRPVSASGIGETLRPAPAMPDAALVLVNPGVALATPDVFRRRSGPFSRPRRIRRAAPTAEALALTLAARSNDLTAAAIELCPTIDTILNALESSEGCLLARMSGSGATCFGLYRRRGQAARAARAIAAAQPHWWVTPAGFDAAPGSA